MAMEVFESLNSPLVLISLVVLLLSCLLMCRRKKYPPGPTSLPFLGNILWVVGVKKRRLRQHVALFELQKTYGDVICLWMMGQPFVYLHGYKAIHDAFVNNADAFSSRPSWLKGIQNQTKEGKGVIWQSGQEWKIIRKFVLQTLRDFGVGKTSLEEKILAEVDAASEYITEIDGNPFDPRLLSSMMVENVIFGIVFAKRYGYKDEEFHTIIHKLDTLFQGSGGISPEAMIPAIFLKLFNKKSLKIRQTRVEILRWIQKYIYDEIDKHKGTFDNDNIRDFVDLYIQTKNQDTDEKLFSEGNIFRVIMDLFIAGSQTTSNAINWCILYMQEYPDVQKRCQEVIHEKCGGSRAVTWTDRGALPYIEAVLLEIQRLANIAPFCVPHSNEVETKIGGYDIPRRSIVVANLYSSNMDPVHWEEPDLFNPERFLEGGMLKLNPAFIPFSTGPRVCLGESLARMEMFLIFTNMLQKFTFSREDERIKHTFEAKFDQFFNEPVLYKTRAIKRI